MVIKFFFVCYALMGFNGFFHSVAVEIVVNGVLRTLWVSSRTQNQLHEA